MRHLILVVAFLLAAALAAGCTNDANAAMLPKVKAETTEAVQAAQVFAYVRKVEFVANMKRELAAIRVESDRLAARVDKSNAAEKADAKVKLDAMREQWVRTSEQLEMAQNANESTWDALRDGFEKSYRDLKESLDGTRQWLSDKIEP
jgi:hypothetical protein